MIYRVLVRSTRSLQPDCTFWEREVLYCGTNLELARIAYLESEPGDFWHGYGNSVRETLIRQFESEPEEIDDTSSAGVEVEVEV